MCSRREARVCLAMAVATASLLAATAIRAAQFHGGVDLVRLSITARDAAGAIVHDLRADEFVVLDEGTPQDVAHFAQHEAPISVVILFDRSGSMMQDDRIMHARDGVREFLQALRPEDEAVVVAFGDTVDMLGGFGTDARTVDRELRRLEAEGGTRLYDAVIEGTRLITSSDRKEKRALLILSDGEDTMSRATLDEAVSAVRQAGVPAYAIGIELNRRGLQTRDDSPWVRLDGRSAIGALKRLTDGSGGWTYNVEAAKRCKDICLRVADELRNQYVLGFYPPADMRDGRWHAISVRTPRPGVSLTTRTGYQASRATGP